jgi:sugar phosphate isomerase/epimerase
VRFEHPARPGRGVRLGYCLNVVAGEDERVLAETFGGLCADVRARVASDGELGVGLYVPAPLAFALAEDGARDRRRRLRGLLDDHGLVAFSANAFPYGGFHAPGLKRGVFRPAWDERERALYTLAVATIAGDLAPADGSHLAISTHTGLHRDEPRALERIEACGAGLALALRGFARLSQHHGRLFVLALEPEPRSLAGDTAQFAALAPRLAAAAERELRRLGQSSPAELVARHLGLCLDTCHAAVEFEDEAAVVRRARDLGLPLGKVQVSSALRLPCPGADAVGRARLLAMDEPVYLHQVTARRGADFLRCGDVAELAEQLRGDAAADWLAADEWRCHFHVPVDAPEPLPDSGGLATTSAEGARMVGALLDDEGLWGTRDLHLEVETYTFAVLPPSLWEGGLAAGLARELDWTRRRIEAAGWARARGRLPGSTSHAEVSDWPVDRPPAHS